MASEFPRSLQEKDWRVLLQRIKVGRCIPFLGAGACHGTLPLGGEVASQWAQDHNYPLDDRNDLAHVAQFLAVEYDSYWPKIEIQQQFKKVAPPNFAEVNEPHGILAELPLPLYMTTNYDDFMVQALQSPPRNKAPRQEYCRWNRFLQDQPSVFESDFKPAIATPLVYHLHGHTGVLESLVLTEDDYLDFLVNISKDEKLLPYQIQKSLAESSLLFLGYRLADWDFRVLFRSLITYMERSLAKLHISAQLVPVGAVATEEQKQNALRYLDEYFGKLDVRVYWGTCREFAAELRRRWEEFK
jgi:hypothetical protein